MNCCHCSQRWENGRNYSEKKCNSPTFLQHSSDAKHAEPFCIVRTTSDLYSLVVNLELSWDAGEKKGSKAGSKIPQTRRFAQQPCALLALPPALNDFIFSIHSGADLVRINAMSTTSGVFELCGHKQGKGECRKTVEKDPIDRRRCT